MVCQTIPVSSQSESASDFELLSDGVVNILARCANSLGIFEILISEFEL